MKLQTALADFDEDILPDGKQKVVSVKIWLNDGSVKIIPKGVKCGVNNNDMGGSDTKGIQPVDKTGKAIGHPVPFKWYKMLEYNGKDLTL